MLKVTSILVLALTATIATAAPNDALKSVPAGQLQGITVLGCEEKEAQSTVSCRSTGKCTITIVTGRVSCKGVRK